jgi:cysteine desulfurase
MIYLDHNATTPVHEEVLAEMEPFFSREFGNPSSAHSLGGEPKRHLADARERLASLLGCSPAEVVFTSGGTESDNTAIKGTAFALREKGNHIVTSKTEHHAVLHTCSYLEERFGCSVTCLDVDEAGRVSADAVREAMRPETILVSIMFANNETGTLNPVGEIAAVAKERGVAFHTDAVQAVGKIPIDVGTLGVDLLSLSSHKLYGPKGVGALVVRKGINLDSLQHGGGHEAGRRAGTENIPGIVGLGKAAEVAAKDLAVEGKRLRDLTMDLWKGIKVMIPEVRLNGHLEERLPNTLNVSFPRIEGESVLMMLDRKGIALSTGSACSSEDLEPSHVLTAMGVDNIAARGALRFSLGRANGAADVETVLKELPPVIERLRQMSPL